MMKAVNLRTEHRINPMGIGERKPFLSWNCQDGERQTAYEIRAYEGKREIWNSGCVKTAGMHAVFGAEAGSRMRITWKIRLWDEQEQPGEWSSEAVFELGLLEKELWKAKWINPEIDDSSEISQPLWGAAEEFQAEEPMGTPAVTHEKEEPKPYHAAAYLKKTFTAKKGTDTRLYITCHGLYTAWLNGQRVGNFVLAPGTGNYNSALPYQTYDVTDLLKDGENELMVVLGDGWYRSCSGVDGDRFLYGEDIALYCQLEQGGECLCVSDESWEATSLGPVRENDMQQGETYDALREELTGWHGVKTEAFDCELAPFENLPIVEKESFAGERIITPDGSVVYDFGQNLAGYVEFALNAHAGDRVRLLHGETLDGNGCFTNANFQPGSRHKEGCIRQEINYICKEGKNHYKPSFTIMGFRFVKIETDADLTDMEITAHAVYSDMEELGSFVCSNEDINQLVRNSIWSQKSNFCDVPTDCPTRERAGWTGDAGVFADTGLYLMDSYPVFRKWLGDCRSIQMEDGRVRNIAPPNSRGSFFTDMLSASVGWGDACIIVPYVLYKRNGDRRILEENYGMMKKWYAYLESRGKESEADGEFRDNPYARYTVVKGMDYGEWCEPGISPMQAMQNPKKSVGTAYLASSGRLLSEISEILGEEDAAMHYREVSEGAVRAYRYSFTKNGKIESDRQCEYVRALAFGLLEGKEAKDAAEELNRMVMDAGYHLNTGFLSTPFLCQVLADYGYVETAYRLLLQDTCPGWLYAVKKGATTIWETWDVIREDGTVHDSLNHYSYGAVCGWMIKGICGIKLEDEKLTIAPAPFPLLTYAKASYLSPAGRIESCWEYESGGEDEAKIKYTFTIPANMTAEIILPDGRTETLGPGSYTY